MMGEHVGLSAGDDAALLLGGAEDFGRFYLRHEDRVLAFFRRKAGSAELAADLTAEAFARALRDRARFDPRVGDAAAWLFGIARHLLADSVRHGRVQDSARRRLGLERLMVDDNALARIDELGADLALAALGELPADQRAAVEARVLGDESYDELAVRLRCSRSVARQRVSRGLRALRERLEASS